MSRHGAGSDELGSVPDLAVLQAEQRFITARIAREPRSEEGAANGLRRRLHTAWARRSKAQL